MVVALLMPPRHVPPRLRYITTQSARGPADKPFMNRLSTGRYVSSSVYIGFRCSQRIVQDCWLRYAGWQEGWLCLLASRPVGVPSCPAPLRPPLRQAPLRLDPPVVFCVIVSTYFVLEPPGGLEIRKMVFFSKKCSGFEE